MHSCGLKRLLFHVEDSERILARDESEASAGIPTDVQGASVVNAGDRSQCPRLNRVRIRASRPSAHGTRLGAAAGLPAFHDWS